VGHLLMVLRHAKDLRSEPEAKRRRQGDSGQLMVRGIVAWTVVLVLTFFLPLRVVTVSVTWTVTELGPAASFLFSVPDSMPSLDSFNPLGRVTFFHLKVVT
jgi:hypothetical protein